MAPSIPESSSHDSWDVISFAVDKGYGVKGPADLGLNALPKQYIQPLEERIITTTVVNDDDDASISIPVIDLSNWNKDVVENMICDAARKWGFFQIVNHGIPLEVLENVNEAAYRFFRLPANEKNKYSKENSASNNVRYGTSFTPEAEKALEWKDFLSLFYVSEEEAAVLWPAACREEALRFMKESELVTTRILNALMKGLNMDLTKKYALLLMGSKRINLNYYPKGPEPELTVGVGRHSDVSTLTILLQDLVGGLYVKKLTAKEEWEWVHVPPIAGAMVINIGDALQIMSNDRFKSVEHMVIANGSSDRISVPIFVNPRPNDIIGPLPEVIIAGGEKPIYKQVLYSDYVKHFFRKAHVGKETIDFAKV